jgi:MoxR-like ATPase
MMNQPVVCSKIERYKDRHKTKQKDLKTRNSIPKQFKHDTFLTVTDQQTDQANAMNNPILDSFIGVQHSLNQLIIGQPALVERLLITLISDGHLLVEGPPGLAKTRAIKTLAHFIQGDFQRIQFTPDLLPADLTGTEIYQANQSEFAFKAGPLFHNIILADEVNRASAKVQSALLEAMGERQITIGQTTHQLPDLFMVMATQNPIEQEGTFPLPEAQLDRFLLHVTVDYPGVKDELAILRLTQQEAAAPELSESPVQLTEETIATAKQQALEVHMSESVEQYIVQLIHATRRPELFNEALSNWIEFGASPRGTLALNRTARAHAWLKGQDYVTPEDVQAVAHDVLRHRLILSYEAQAEGITADSFIDRLLTNVAFA